MKDVPVKLGPLALLLTVISICMTTLAILAFSTASADHSLAEKYAQTVRERYALEAKGQRFLGETGDELAQGYFTLEGGCRVGVCGRFAAFPGERTDIPQTGPAAPRTGGGGFRWLMTCRRQARGNASPLFCLMRSFFPSSRSYSPGGFRRWWDTTLTTGP